MKTVIEMAGEVDAVTKILLDKKVPQGMSHDVFLVFLERFAELVRADERNRTWTQEHWTEYERNIAAAEREACAKLCETSVWSRDVRWWQSATKSDVSVEAALQCAEAIRARGQA